MKISWCEHLAKRLFLGTLAVLALLVAAPATAKKKSAWIELQTPSFTVYSSSSARVTRHFAEQLEQFRAALAQTSPFKLGAAVPTVVYLFNSDSRFDPYRPLHAREGGGKVAGYFVANSIHGNFIAMLADTSVYNPLETVFHEYMHYVLNNNFDEVPLWFNEGVAEYFSSFVYEKGKAHLGRPVPMNIQLLKRYSMLPLRDLLAVDHSSPIYRGSGEDGALQRAVLYSQAWLMVHYFMMGPGHLPQLTRYLSLTTQTNLPADEAFLHAFDTSYEDLESRLLAYARQPSLPFARVEIETSESSAWTVRPMQPAESFYRLGALLLRLRGREHAAEDLFRQALELDPENGLSLAGLGVLAAKRGEQDTALELFEKARSKAPEHYLPAYLYGDHLLSAHDSNNPETREAVRLAFEHAIEVAPDLAPAWVRLAFLAAGEADVTERGILAAETAHRLLPRRRDAAKNLFSLYLRAGRRAAAERLVETYFMVHASPDELATAQEQLARLAPQESAND